MTTSQSIEDSFERFWNNYPSRHGTKGSKQEALTAFKKFSLSEMSDIVLAAYNFAQSEAVKKGALVPDAVRFLVKGRGKEKINLWREWVEVKKTNYRTSEYYISKV